MCSSIRTNKKTVEAWALALLICGPLWAAEEGQNMPGQITDDHYYEELLKDEAASGEQSFLPGGVATPEALSGPAMKEERPLDKPGYYKDVDAKEGAIAVAGADHDPGHFIEYKDKALFQDFAREGKSTLAVGWMADKYDYTDTRGIHKDTYQSQGCCKMPGSLVVSNEYFIWRSFMEAYWGGNLGLGYQTGKGKFADGTSSYAEFSLWLVPFDLSLGLALPVGNFFKLAVEGGPSVMGLMQSRSDKESGEKYKRRRQISTGYYGEARLGLSITRLMNGLGKSLYEEYGATQFFLNFVLRTHNYGNFQDDLKISGSSYGVTFSFEYL